jgi:multiple sugar transport system permease protein
MSAMTELVSLRKVRAARPAKPSKAERREGRAAYLFLLPWMLGMVLLTVGPMAVSLYLSFTDYNLLQAPNWIGLENFIRMLGDERLHNSFGVTFHFVLVSVPLQLIAALLLAVVLDRGLRGLALYRSIFYLPSLLGGSVAVAVLWRQIFGIDGLVNQVLALFGIEGHGWVSSPDTALDMLIILSVWTFGAPMIIVLAGLRQIPRMYYEAASVDGASRSRQFFRITLPLLTPIIFFNFVLQIIGAFQTFTQAFVVSNGTGGPADSTMFYTLYLYQMGFKNFDMGYASAMAWVLLVIIAMFTLVNFIGSKYWVFYDD